MLRRPHEARVVLDALLRVDPGFGHGYFVRALVEIAVGAWADAIATIEKSLDIGGDYPFAYGALCYAYAARGDESTARRLFDDLQARAAKGFVPPFAIAIALTGLSETSAALDALHRGVDERDLLLAENLFDPIFDRLRDEPRYATLLERMGIPLSRAAASPGPR